jgi:YHS domain-containing protein
MGVFGQVVRIGDIMKLVVNPGSKPAGNGHPTAGVSSATAIDPICGMTVALTDTAITLVQDGETYAFCCTACRDAFAAQQDAAASA